MNNANLSKYSDNPSTTECLDNSGVHPEMQDTRQAHLSKQRSRLRGIIMSLFDTSSLAMLPVTVMPHISSQPCLLLRYKKKTKNKTRLTQKPFNMTYFTSICHVKASSAKKSWGSIFKSTDSAAQLRCSARALH